MTHLIGVGPTSFRGSPLVLHCDARRTSIRPSYDAVDWRRAPDRFLGQWP